MEFAFLTLDLNRIESCGAKDNVGTWKVLLSIIRNHINKDNWISHKLDFLMIVLKD